MPPVEFEPTISAGEQPQTYALDRPATETGAFQWLKPQYMCSAMHFISTKLPCVWFEVQELP
jgi:hypothetical protein